MNRWLKHIGELALGSGPSLVAAQLVRPVRSVILAYHNTIMADSPAFGDRSLHLPFAQFVQQVCWLRRMFDIVRLDDVFKESHQKKPFAAITFDDAYEGAVRNAIPYLIAEGIPATMFVCSSWTGGEVPWWDALATAGGLDVSLRNEALTACAGRGPGVLELARQRGALTAEVPSEYRIASSADITCLAQNPLVDIGMHSHSHANLPVLEDCELLADLTATYHETRARFTRAVDWLAYPYGLWDERVASAVRDVGFSGALRVSGGPIRNIQSVDRFAVPRVNVPSGLSAGGFRIRCFGLR